MEGTLTFSDYYHNAGMRKSITKVYNEKTILEFKIKEELILKNTNYITPRNINTPI